VTEPRPAEPRTDWSHRVKVWGGITVAVLVGLLIGAAFIPRWWAQRVGDQANESFTGGIMLGLFYGFIFTILPLLLIIWGIRRRRSAKAWLWILGGVALLALPNLFTLGITLGPGSGAHAGDRTLDVEAPGFRGAVLAGAIVAVVALVALIRLLRSRRLDRQRADRLEAELRSRDDTPVTPDS
jgi:uncharacterized membrane protein